MININKLMVEALNEANVTNAPHTQINNAKKRILKSFSKNNKETFKGEIGTDLLVKLMIETLYLFTYKRNTHSISYLTSKVTPMLESEVAWIRLNNATLKSGRTYLKGFVGSINKTQAINFKLNANTKFNVIKLLNKLDYKKLNSKNPLKKFLVPKRYNKFCVTVATDVSTIRSLIYSSFENFFEYHIDYELKTDGHGTKIVTKINNINSEAVNYMYNTPQLLSDVKAYKFDLTRSIHRQSVEVALQSAYTFNVDYNNAIEAVIESGNHIKYFDAENEDALKAKVETVENDVKYGMQFWNELNNGNVYFNYVVDFRGRISQLGGLSAVGHKVGKTMLRAGISKPIGAHGLKHLLIALASSMGYDKSTFIEREEWAYDNMDTYVEIGEMIISNPVKAFKLLHNLDADDIFNAAAISLELYYISKFDGEIEDFKSNLFVGYDATCSGLQIVSLLWGNKRLAEHTNVAKFTDKEHTNMTTEDKIYDIYKYLYQAMDKVIPEFAPTTESTPDGEELMSVWDNLKAKTKRTIAKKLLMPRIYGSTFRTWSANTRKVAGKKDIFAYEKDDERRESLIFQFGIVIANLFKLTFDKEEGFQAFRDFDDVVGQVANAYNSKKMNTTWTIHESSTFINQKITAIYKELKSARYYVYGKGVNTRATSYHVSIFESALQAIAKVNKTQNNNRKAKNAISPNFVHSLDALLLHTVNYSMKTTMRLTHDCFAATAGEVETMMQVINDSYISLFGGQNDIMVKLATETKENTGVKIILPETLNHKGIDCNSIKKGNYKFS